MLFLSYCSLAQYHKRKLRNVRAADQTPNGFNTGLIRDNYLENLYKRKVYRSVCAACIDRSTPY